jgi:hypothetical protein
MSTTSGLDNRLGGDGYPSTPGLYPIERAARIAGMSSALLEAGIVAGQIPVMLRKVGPSNKRFVNVEQLNAWINEKPAADGNNLFQ